MGGDGALTPRGLIFRSTSDRKLAYHPTASEILEGVDELKDLARSARAKRIELAKQAKADAKAVKKAEEVGVMVCLADSLRAGNCRAGSENWARNHGFDTRRHYTPAELLAMANGDTRRVALVCLAATRRTIAELSRGFSVVADHRT